MRTRERTTWNAWRIWLCDSATLPKTKSSSTDKSVTWLQEGSARGARHCQWTGIARLVFCLALESQILWQGSWRRAQKGPSLAHRLGVRNSYRSLEFYIRESQMQLHLAGWDEQDTQRMMFVCHFETDVLHYSIHDTRCWTKESFLCI